MQQALKKAQQRLRVALLPSGVACTLGSSSSRSRSPACVAAQLSARQRVACAAHHSSHPPRRHELLGARVCCHAHSDGALGAAPLNNNSNSGRRTGRRRSRSDAQQEQQPPLDDPADAARELQQQVQAAMAAAAASAAQPINQQRSARGSNGGGSSSNRGPPPSQQPPQQPPQQQQERRQQPSGKQHRHQQQRAREAAPPLLLFQGGAQASSSAPANTAAAAAGPSPAAITALITARLTAASSLSDLMALTRTHERSLGPVHVAAAVSRAAKLVAAPGSGGFSSSGSSPSQQQQQQRRRGPDDVSGQLLSWLRPLLTRFLGQLEAAGPAELSCVVGGLARMSATLLRPRSSGSSDATFIRDTTQACLDASLPMLAASAAAAAAAAAAAGGSAQAAAPAAAPHRSSSSGSSSDGGGFDNKLLMQLAWGAARLSVVPSEAWLAVFGDVTHLRLASLNNVETANLIWVWAKWERPPAQPWLDAYLQQQLPGQLLLLQPPELSSVLWAVTMLRLRLPPQLLDALLLEAQVKFAGFTGQGLATLGWCLARMDIRPSRLWLQDYVRHTWGQLDALSGGRRDQPFTNIIWALACWEHAPPPAWLAAFCRAVLPLLPRMDTHTLTITAVSLAELRHAPPPQLGSYLLELFHRSAMMAAAAAAAAGGDAALAGVGGGSSSDTGAGSSSSSAAGSSSSSAGSRAGQATNLASRVSAFVWALPRLLGASSTGSSTTGSGSSGAGQQQQQRQLSVDWRRQYCWLLQDLADVLLPALPRLSPTDLVDVAAGLADVGHFPGVAWMDAHEAAVNRQLDQLSTTQLALIKAAYSGLEAAQGQQAAALLPEQARLLQQQQAAAGSLMQQQLHGAGFSSSISSSSRAGSSAARWQAERLSVAAAAAAAATAGVQLPTAGLALGDRQPGGGANARLLKASGPSAAAAQAWQQQQQRVPAWMADEEAGPDSGSGGSRRRGGDAGGVRRTRTGRIKGARRHMPWLKRAGPDADERGGGSSSFAGGGRGGDDSDDGSDDGMLLSLGGESDLRPELPPQLPNKPRSARIRLQHIREAERRQRQEAAAAASGGGGGGSQPQQHKKGAGPPAPSRGPQWSWLQESEF